MFCSLFQRILNLLDANMKVIPAYFDGNTVRPLTQIDAKKNQLLSITILDSYLSDDKETTVNELCGEL